MTFFIALFILLLQYVWKYIDDLVGKGLDFSVIAQLLFYATASMVPLALPLAILLSSLMTFGNFGEHYELVAMKSAGISLQKTMRPLVVTAIVISVSAFFFSNFPRECLGAFFCCTALLHPECVHVRVQHTKPTFLSNLFRAQFGLRPSDVRRPSFGPAFFAKDVPAHR